MRRGKRPKRHDFSGFTEVSGRPGIGRRWGIPTLGCPSTRSTSDSVPAALTLTFASLDAFSDPVLVLDETGRVQHVNREAAQRLEIRPGVGLQALESVLGLPMLLWLQSRLAGRAAAQPPVPGGRRLPTLEPLGDRRWLLVLPAAMLMAPVPAPEARPLTGVPRPPASMPLSVVALDDGPLRDLHRVLWGSPFPALLQDESFRILDANEAFVGLGGWSPTAIRGRDLLQMLPQADHAAVLAERERMQASPEAPDVPAQVEHRILDSQGRERWVRCARYLTLTREGRRVLLTIMQDTTAEHHAREQAERYSLELDQWFEFSPMGMVLFDEDGQVMRSNPAFHLLVGPGVRDLHELAPEVRVLLQRESDQMELPLDAADAWVTSEGLVPLPGGGQRWVRAALRCYEVRSGRRRYMCMLEDRTAEEERDLAQLQLGALVDTAGVGLATFRDEQWSSRAEAARPPSSAAALQAVRRDLVLVSSLPEFERLQRALKTAERCEARYAIQHPELGVRWLVTRVEPGHLASGRVTTSVVTLDVTDQQRAQERAEQVLAELTTILESSPAGIASMRGYTLMHCNRRFESMLRLPAGSGVGSDIRALLATRTIGLQASPDSITETLEHGVLYEAEIEVPADDGTSRWYALSIRRTAPGGDAPQSIALLSEITRLKVQAVQLESLAHEREQMAQVLGQQADRNRAVLDSVLVGIVTVNPQGAITWLNRSARRMFDGDLGDFLGQPLAAVASGDGQHPFHHSLKLFEELRDGEAVKFECRVQGRDGRNFWVVGNAVATVGASGNRELTYALMDIEQRRQAEARIAEARSSLQRIIEVAPMAITLYDARTLAVLQLNRVAAALSGVDADQAIGRLPEHLYSAEQAARVRTDLQTVLHATEAVTHREYVFESPEHGVQVWDARYLPLTRVAGRVTQILMVASDVTAQRAAQRAELEAAISQREMLVQEVHHRIKNNLQGVAGLLQQVGARRPEVQAVISEVVGQVQAIAQVYGLQVGKIGPLKVRSVVEAIAQSVQRTFGRTIELSVDGTGPAREWSLPEAESIPIALTLNELLTNAIKHSPGGSAISCRLALLDKGVQVEISNRGQLSPGFRIEHRPAAVSGLGLVRALLPRRNAALDIEQLGEQVVASIVLSAPVVVRVTQNEEVAAVAA